MICMTLMGKKESGRWIANLSLIHIWEQHEKKPVLHLHATGQYGVQLFKDLEKEKNFAEGDGLDRKSVE